MQAAKQANIEKFADVLGWGGMLSQPGKRIFSYEDLIF